MIFYKYHGLGNDFILVEEKPKEDLIKELCKRKYGIGADGLLYITNENGLYRMVVYNSDGSRAEMCGNGLRVIMYHLYRNYGIKEALINTDSGVKEAFFIKEKNKNVAEIKVEIGVPEFDPKKISINSTTPWIEKDVKDYLELDNRFTAVSFGNPHFVTFDKAEKESIKKFSHLLEKLPIFPNGTNVEWGELKENNTIYLQVWERGCGFTEACGSGATAATAVALKLGLIDRNKPIQVIQPGGTLTLSISPKGIFYIQGEACFVFKGEIEI